MLRSLIIGGVVVVFCASFVQASPIIDGDVGSGEYTNVIDDTGDESLKDFFSTGLDMATMQFDDDSGWLYLAMTVVGEPVDRNGDPTSFDEETNFKVKFYDTAGTTPCYLLDIVITGTDVEVELEYYNGSSWSDVTLNPGDYEIAVGDALEFKIDESKMSNLPDSFSFRSRLDGTGEWDDDQMSGHIPEPATLILLGLGAVGSLLRRRR